MFKHKDKIIWLAASVAFIAGVVIFALKGWEVAEPWTFILSGGIPLLLAGLYLFVFKKAPEQTTTEPVPQPATNNVSPSTNSLTMTYEQIKDLINKNNYISTFEELDKVWDQIPDYLRSTYSQLKATFLQGQGGANYHQRLVIFVGQLKGVLGEDDSNSSDNPPASGNGGGRVINTTNYFENTGTVNLDQRNTPKDDE